MIKIFLLFYRRNWKEYSLVYLSTLFVVLIVSLPSLGGAVFERISIDEILNQREEDLEISSSLKWSFSSNNFSNLLSHQEHWNIIKQEWEKITYNDYFILIIEYNTEGAIIFIGIDLSHNLINIKKESFSAINFGFFNLNFSLETFSSKEKLPFNLDILISLEFLNESIPEEFLVTSENSKLGYSINFDRKQIKTISQYSKKIEDIHKNFETYLAREDLGLFNKIEKNYYDTSSILFFKQPFDTIIFLVSLIIVLSSSWVIEFFTELHNKKTAPVINQFTKLGIDIKIKKRITIILPIMTDSLAFFSFCSIYFIFSLMFGLNLVLVYITTSLCFLYLVYKRLRKTTYLENSKTNTYSLIIRYFVILAFFILTPLLLKQLLSNLLSDKIFSLIFIISETIQYYIVIILLTKIFIYILAKYISRKNTLNNLIFKIINSRKVQLQYWFHSTIQLIWAITIVSTSFQTFSTNYETNFKMQHPTDLVVNTDIFLYNASQILLLDEFAEVLPITHNVETFFQSYDLYLMNFSAVKKIVPDFRETVKLAEIIEGHSYISKEFAEKLNFNDGDYFPTKFGENGSNIYINQPLIITEYFPLIKPIDNRPFVVSSYNDTLNNITKVNKLFMNYSLNVTSEEGINALKDFLQNDFQIQEEFYKINFYSVFQLYQICFAFFATIIVFLSFSQLINRIIPVLYTMNQRGLSKKTIRKSLLKNLSLYLVFSLIIGLSLGIFFIIVQLSSSIYQTAMFTPIQISFSCYNFLIFLIPIECFFYLLKKKISFYEG